jgi:nucleoside diphosphate kinase
VYDFAYVLITPYSLLKSRTGGILARILSNSDLDLKAVKLFAPSESMVNEYIEAFSHDSLSDHNRDLFCTYIQDNLRRCNPSKISNRCVLLILEGDNAASVLRRVVGHITHKPKGDTVRGTFGDYITHGNTTVYFEPAVLCATDEESARRHLAVFKKYEKTDSGVLSSVLQEVSDKKNCETTLVMLKPDNLRRKSTRAGNIIDMFSKTGLYIVGAKLIQFSVAQAQEFYSPLASQLEIRLEKIVRTQIEDILAASLPFEVNAEDLDFVARRLRKNKAQYEFNRIIEYITGINPTMIPASEYHLPGKERCLILLYYGVDAINKIRDKLGATDPQLAEEGTVRSEFGHDILRNGVHASDSVKSAVRERKVVGLSDKAECDLERIIPS